MTDETRLPAPTAGSVRDLLRTEAVKQRFEEVLKENSAQFIASLASLVYASKQLKACDPMSVIISAIKAAALDLPIERELGFAAIVPYGNEATFQMQWKGYVQLALRTQQYASLNVTEVYEGMVTGVDPFTGKVKRGQRKVLEDGTESEKVIGYYAYFELLNGFEKEVYMSVEKVMAHGKRYSKTFNYAGSTWKTDPDAMGRKTVLKQLLTRYGPMSVQMMNAVKAEALPEEEELPEMSPEQRAKAKAALFGEEQVETKDEGLYTREQAEAETAK